jgi:hypothetical protein
MRDAREHYGLNWGSLVTVTRVSTLKCKGLPSQPPTVRHRNNGQGT